MLKKRQSDCFLFFLKNYRIEFKYIFFLKKALKKIRFKMQKRGGVKPQKLFVSLKKNYILSKKSKNARMGKGKGAFIREAIKVKKYKPFVYAYGYSIRSVFLLSKYFDKKTNKKSSCFVNVERPSLFVWSNNTITYEYTANFLYI